MRAIMLEKPGTMSRIETAAPPHPGRGEALVKVHCVGICGTDISGYLGKMPFFSYPRIPGHELGVEVLHVGEDVTHVSVGDRCSVEPYINCGQCFACHRGAVNCCENLQVLGVHCDGGLRSEFVLPARILHVATGLSYEQAAIVETLAIGRHAVRRAAVTSDESVLVIGAGPIGLSAIVFAKLFGARVIVLDMQPSRLEFCKRHMGVDETIEFHGDDSEIASLRAVTDNHLPTVVIDATGSPKSMSHTLNYASHAGRIVYVGIVTSDIAFPHPLMHRKELTLLASRNAMSDDFTSIIEGIVTGRIDTRPWITHRTPIDQLPEVFPSYTRPETGVIKAIVDVS